MNIEWMLPLSMLLGLMSFGLMARWYVLPWTENVDLHTSLRALVFPHTFRYVGLAFLIPGVTHQALDSRFALSAAYGDLLAAIMAFGVLYALGSRGTTILIGVWVFNLVGFLDLVYAVSQGVRWVPAPHFGATYFIPSLAVPFLVVTHVVIFSLLWNRGRELA